MYRGKSMKAAVIEVVVKILDVSFLGVLFLFFLLFSLFLTVSIAFPALFFFYFSVMQFILFSVK